MYTIGIVDNLDQQKIQETITRTFYVSDQVEFKAYDSGDGESLVEEIVSDVNQGNLHSLITEYQIDGIFNGGCLWETIHKRIPEFPVVVLTNMVHEAVDSLYVDADKVYNKDIFFVFSKKSFDIIHNILWNMKRYVEGRRSCEIDFNFALEKLERYVRECVSCEVDFDSTLKKLDRCVRERVSCETDLDSALKRFNNEHGGDVIDYELKLRKYKELDHSVMDYTLNNLEDGLKALREAVK